MRTMRLNSRMTMVLNPTHSARASEAGMSGARSGDARRGLRRALRERAHAVIDQADEEFLETIHLVAHARDLEPEARELHEDLVEALALGDLDLEGVIVDERGAKTLEVRRARHGRRQIEHERLGLELAQHVRHGIALDDAPALDDRDVAAQTLRLLEIMRRQDDRRALIVDLTQELPHRAADLDVDARGRLIEDQEPGLVHERAIISRRFMPPESERAIELRRSQSCSFFRYFSARCRASGRGMP